MRHAALGPSADLWMQGLGMYFGFVWGFFKGLFGFVWGLFSGLVRARVFLGFRVWVSGEGFI